MPEMSFLAQGPTTKRLKSLELEKMVMKQLLSSGWFLCVTLLLAGVGGGAGASGSGAMQGAAASGNAQARMPTAAMDSLLNMRFYEASGGFMIEGIEVAFAPADSDGWTLAIVDKDGNELASQPLRLESMPEFPAFAMLRPQGPGMVKSPGEGDFVMQVRQGDAVVTALPFALKQQRSGDEFNEKSTWLREGAWSELGYLAVRDGEPDSHVTFNWWDSIRTMPSGAARANVTVHLMQGGKEVAASNPAVILSSPNWMFFSRELALTQGGEYLTKAALEKMDGAFTIEVRDGDKRIRSFAMRIKDGAMQALDHAKMTYPVHHEILLPRTVDTSSGSNSSYHLLDVSWVKKD